VVLFTNTTFSPSDLKGKVFADLTLAAFTGYAMSSAITWGTAFVDLDGNVMQTGDKKQFLATADTPATPPITGAALVDTAGTKLLAIDLFLKPDGTPNPVSMETNGDALDYVPRFAFVDEANQ